MRPFPFFVALFALVEFRALAGGILMSLTGLGALANFGGLAVGSFLAGRLAAVFTRHGPPRRQLMGLAALGIVVSLGISFLKGVNYSVLAEVLIILLNTPLSYALICLGARFAGADIDAPPPRRGQGSR